MAQVFSKLNFVCLHNETNSPMVANMAFRTLPLSWLVSESSATMSGPLSNQTFLLCCQMSYFGRSPSDCSLCILYFLGSARHGHGVVTNTIATCKNCDDIVGGWVECRSGGGWVGSGVCYVTQVGGWSSSACVYVCLCALWICEFPPHVGSDLKWSRLSEMPQRDECNESFIVVVQVLEWCHVVTEGQEMG